MRDFDPNTRERPLELQMADNHVRRDCSTSMIGTLSVLILAIVLGTLFWNIASTNRGRDSAGGPLGPPKIAPTPAPSSPDSSTLPSRPFD